MNRVSMGHSWWLRVHRFFHSWGGRQSEVRVSAGTGSLWGSSEASFLVSGGSSCSLAVALSFQSQHLSSPVLLFFLLMCSLFFLRTILVEFRAWQDPGWSHLEMLNQYICEDPPPQKNKSYSHGIGCHIWRPPFCYHPLSARCCLVQWI